MGLEEMMRKLFKKYGSIPPESIYYFRDGVSDGQYAKVRRGRCNINGVALR